MRLSRVEKARQQAAAGRNQNSGPLQLDLRGLASKLVGGPLLPTQEEFILSPERIKLYMGPVGCAKTSSLCASVIIPAMLYPGSRWGVFRSNWWTLESTTLKRFMECLHRLGPSVIVDKRTGPPLTLWIASARRNEDGSPGEPAEIIFHGLDDASKQLSQEYTGVAIDEVSEIDEAIVTTLNTRLRHKYAGQVGNDGPFFLMMACNPVRRSHWIHRKFCGEADCDPVPWGRKFKPHPKENSQNLPPDYYNQISSGLSPDMVLRYIEGECGPDPSGLPVFREFSTRMHVGDLKYIPGSPMIRGWDFGRRRPAVVWAQTTREGWHNKLRCVLGDNESLEQFARRIMMISSVDYPQASSWIDYVDPHGEAKEDVADLSRVDMLRRMGLNPRFRYVNIETGLEFMSRSLNTLVQGRPRSMYDRHGCNILIEGYAGGYTFPNDVPGRMQKQKPAADGYYEHVMDADRYIEVNLQMGSTAPRDSHASVLRKIINPHTGR